MTINGHGSHTDWVSPMYEQDHLELGVWPAFFYATQLINEEAGISGLPAGYFGDAR